MSCTVLYISEKEEFWTDKTSSAIFESSLNSGERATHKPEREASSKVERQSHKLFSRDVSDGMALSRWDMVQTRPSFDNHISIVGHGENDSC
jgi:hypothetical protein